MTINEAQDEVIEQFQDFTDWMDKYQLLIDLGGDLEPLDDKYKNEQKPHRRLSKPRVGAVRHDRRWSSRLHR